MELMPLQNDCAQSPFDFLSSEIKLSNPNTVSFHTNGSSIAIPMRSFTSFDSLSSENITSCSECCGDGILSSDTLPPCDASTPLCTEPTIDADPCIPAQDVPFFPCGFSADACDSFLLHDCMNELTLPSPQHDFQRDGECSFESSTIRTRDNSLDSDFLVSDALLHDADSVAMHDLHLSFSDCFLPVSAPLKRRYTVCGDLAKSRLSFLTRNDKRVDSSSLKPVRHDTRFGDVYQCSSDKDCFFIFSKKHVEYLRSYRSF